MHRKNYSALMRLESMLRVGTERERENKKIVCWHPLNVNCMSKLSTQVPSLDTNSTYKWVAAKCS